uniref:Uncharacterized protein n=1 Tax=Kwoniella bestiolae CBS 10118 TaxID=1296100 RepID=A0A1B9GB22_9TREE|nr:hypothetical protein I302_03054 [Kwoniella bestiolae CBS 10118]OCF28202.1 hypothetical protein I302_03054 [Kwoniella bestiolae CBS 10118]
MQRSDNKKSDSKVYVCGSIQIFSYLHGFPKDSWLAKVFVAVLGIVVTIESVVICVGLVKTSIQHPQDVAYALAFHMSPLGWVRSLTSSIIAFMTQVFMIVKFMKFFRSLSYQERSVARTDLLYRIGMSVLLLLATFCLAAGLADPIFLSVLDVMLIVLFSLKLQRSRIGFKVVELACPSTLGQGDYAER